MWLEATGWMLTCGWMGAYATPYHYTFLSQIAARSMKSTPMSKYHLRSFFNLPHVDLTGNIYPKVLQFPPPRSLPKPALDI